MNIPSPWSIVKAKPWQVADSCSVEVVRKKRRTAKPERVLTLELFSATHEEICDKVMICQDENGEWQIAGRAGATNQADVKETPAWREIVGLSETGSYDEERGYQGMAQVYVALLDNRKGRMAIFVGSSDFAEEKLFNAIVSSFRFAEPAN